MVQKCIIRTQVFECYASRLVIFKADVLFVSVDVQMAFLSVFPIVITIGGDPRDRSLFKINSELYTIASQYKTILRHFAVIYLFFPNRHSLVEMDTLFYKEPAIIYR